MTSNILSIAGSDPSGGAGIQADLKTFAARGTYGMSVLTALTAQNTRGVFGVHFVPAAFVADQLRAVLDDIQVDAIKIGMIGNAEIAEAIADILADRPHIPIVLDPVMVAKGGAPLLEADAVEAVRTRLLPLAALITPNLPEAAALLRRSEATDRTEMAVQADALRRMGPQAVLVKGGHLESAESPDVLIDSNGTTWFESPRLHTRNTHGTGCTLSSAIAAEMGKGSGIAEAVRAAKHYLATAIERSHELQAGSGHGPVHHFHEQWQPANDCR
ncbi:bifunctional hydroxymethylpyrimidine kinase/phosphomethylpyrimidine kinase [Pseudorhizobium endolithicum]|uniref:hydroxymethylpyrimidine kinase n=1 Tax=Pseudorhizobium endolithicum TaxID=1191678 RepID=A0ABN7JUD2_9HYPH|nr:bifunctional hydroxymethylpyrimidine kinase/phosphomethylpyrimidine kinase [Pseudorhizobium endolithicum]CAD7048757.1 bifunctional hydroxymethylpyrimidine kinase/phosphomethylpyrimidine kinase [Pseudorhizobium endolithicum]